MSSKKRVVILGSTGSIGESALKVARDIPNRMEVVGLAAGRSAQALLAQAAEFKPRAVALYETPELDAIRGHLPSGTACHGGPEGLIELATMPEADLVLISIVGTAGLAPALAAIRAGKDIAVASKEILVMAGEEVTREAAKHKVAILPVDSEHNAIFQCLVGEPSRHIRRLILTASGGPFRKTPAAELGKVTPAQALKHPTWNMGRKITIDSATLFNKGLEMIEARWLFGVPMDQVDVVVHPQSIVHSLVEFVDGSQLAQLSHSDMCFPIQYAVTYPDRLPNRLKPLCLAEMGSLTFEAPDPEKFPALRLAREAGAIGGTLPAVLNAANEIAVPAFLDGKIPFPAIWHTVEAVMKRHHNVLHPGLDKILQADAWARAAAQEVLQTAVS
ncbi:MAG: 1-deoxy-D-xylulose-5-phosphate reductoisomerase [Methylacidiphilales bacterium]|nr:1-deoxy-D-xylulose-5-phosphate reductoisomerase [Candidatus Methylacidiphilales bacterium]